MHRECGEAVVQVAPEATGLDLGLQVAVGRRHHANVDLAHALRAERPDLALLQYTHQLDLERRGGLADLVEEDRAAIGDLEQADPGRRR